MTISQSTLFLTIGALLALTPPAAAQSTAREALAVRPAAAQRAMIDQVISAQTGGERPTILGLWAYALSDSTLLYCGYRHDASYRKTGFAIVMNGVDRDSVVVNMSEASLREAGCARPGYTALSAIVPGSDPLFGAYLDNPRPDPVDTGYRVIRFPMESANEPDCMAGRALAYEAVMLSRPSVLDGVPREAMNDQTRLFGLCFNASGQEFMNLRIGQIAADADARMAPLRARAYLAQASIHLNRLRARGF